MKKIAFVCDSGTGRDVATLKAEGIYSLPLQVASSVENYEELEDISIDEIYRKIAEGELLKTSLPMLGKIDELFADLKAKGYEGIFAVPICIGLSGTMNALRLAAQQNDLEFIGVDTCVTAEVEYYCISEAKKMYDAGIDLDTIQTKLKRVIDSATTLLIPVDLNHLKRGGRLTPLAATLMYDAGIDLDTIQTKLKRVIDSATTLLIPVDLNHLKRGGRLTPLAATLAGLLKIKPIMKIDTTTDGKIDVAAKVRTLNKAMDQAIEILDEHGVDAGYRMFVAYVGEKENCEVMMEKLKAHYNGINISLIKLISCVGVHTGIGCVAIQAYKEL